MADRIQYNPNTIIPDSPEGLQKYLQEELDKIAYTFANLDIVAEIVDADPGDGPVVPYPTHGELDGREAFESHPMSAITGLVEDQLRQDVLIDRNTKVFFGPDEPPVEEVSAGDLWFQTGYD